MATSRLPITCHVLDTTVGKPAPGISVILTLKQPTQSSSAQYTAITDHDGRVGSWKATQNAPDLQATFDGIEGDMSWDINFGTGEYWAEQGVKPFFPEVEIKFLTTGFKSLGTEDKRPHWHVPLLLGPYTYTTYRGS